MANFFINKYSIEIYLLLTFKFNEPLQSVMCRVVEVQVFRKIFKI